MENNNQKHSKLMRINKYLSLCGVASRRKSDTLIKLGKVSINGELITKPGFIINPDSDTVLVDGKKAVAEDHAYFKFYKPEGYITTVNDDRKRQTVMDFFNDVPYSVFPVGRLDKHSQGLLIVTNDGDLANRLTHPSYKIEKVYEAGINTVLADNDLNLLRNGIKLDEGITAKCNIEVTHWGKNSMELLIVLKQGWNRQIRRMIESVGAKVTYLKRTFVGEIGLRGLKPGEKKKLTDKELKTLKQSVGL